MNFTKSSKIKKFSICFVKTSIFLMVLLCLVYLMDYFRTTVQFKDWLHKIYSGRSEYILIFFFKFLMYWLSFDDGLKKKLTESKIMEV